MKAKLTRLTLMVGLLLLWGGVGSAYADNFAFNFTGLATNATNAQIQTYMNNQLHSGESVVVTGAVGDNGYTGDGHVVKGPGSVLNSSYTLRQMDSGTFIINNNPGGSSDIKMTFTGLTISSITFDFEIFPDGSCTKLLAAYCGGTNNPNQPDLKLVANGSLIQTWLGVTPSGTYVNSPNGSAVTGANPETAPQLIGSATVTFATGAGITTLDFQDWPATIGIANLKITTPPSQNAPVPEPSSLLLLGTGLLGGLGAIKRKFLS